jgi:hypothetical protein
MKTINFKDLSDLQKKAAIAAKEEGYSLNLDGIYQLLSDILGAPERKRDHELLCGAESLTTLLEKTKSNFIKL